MNVVISPNLRHTKVQIDVNGNEVKPFTREVVKAAEESTYTPSKEELEKISGKPVLTEEQLKEQKKEIKTGEIETPKITITPKNTPATENPLADMIKKQINNAVQDAIKDIDISKMVADAIKEAFTLK